MLTIDDLNEMYKAEARAERGEPEAPKARRGKPELCGFDELRPLDTHWIWPGRVAQGWLTLVAGEAGAGKSLVLMDLVSRVSRGAAFPQGISVAVNTVLQHNTE